MVCEKHMDDCYPAQQECAACLGDVISTLRAENTALKVENERLLAANKDNANWFEDARAEAEKSQSLATALAARVEALEDVTKVVLAEPNLDAELAYGLRFILSSTPGTDLAAHDDRIRRETLETLNLLARYIMTHHPKPIGDGACLECYPDNAFTKNDFVCGWHTAKRLAALRVKGGTNG